MPMAPHTKIVKAKPTNAQVLKEQNEVMPIVLDRAAKNKPPKLKYDVRHGGVVERSHQENDQHNY